MAYLGEQQFCDMGFGDLYKSSKDVVLRDGTVVLLWDGMADIKRWYGCGIMRWYGWY